MRNPLKPRMAILLGIVAFLVQSSSAQKTLFEKFYAMDSLAFQLVTDLDSLLKKRDDYVDADLQVFASGGHREEWKTRLKPRGRFRRSWKNIA